MSWEELSLLVAETGRVGEGNQTALRKEDLRPPSPRTGLGTDRSEGAWRSRCPLLAETCENTVKKSFDIEEGKLKRFSDVSG